MQKASDLQNRAVIAPQPEMLEKQDELRALKGRIEQARVTKDGETNHCADCFRRGRDAALRIIDGA